MGEDDGREWELPGMSVRFIQIEKLRLCGETLLTALRSSLISHEVSSAVVSYSACWREGLVEVEV